MKVKNQNWSIEKLQSLESKINPQPQYQRGPVWGLAAKQLLIDSILSDFDIPKIYLNTRNVGGNYDYDITDGQQRLRAIWEYLGDKFAVGDITYDTNAVWRKKKFTALSVKEKDHLLKFELVIAVITSATNDEVRELFSRLQRGVRLNPPELRNSIPSQLGDAIRSIADTHGVFTHASCPFDDSRFEHRDLCAHTFALLLYAGKKDLKAPLLKAMFIDHSSKVPDDSAAKVMKVLDMLKLIQEHSEWAVKTKWGYVDLCLYLITHLEDKLDMKHVAERYSALEKQRRRYTSNPEVLLEGKTSGAQKRLYKYIVAFKNSGGLTKNIQARHDVLNVELRQTPRKKRK